MMLQESQRVKSKIPMAFEALMGPHTSKVDTALEPGLTKLSWTSLNIQEYMDKVYKTLADLELLMDRAHDVNEFRIESVLKEMATTTLCQMPEDEPWTVEKFLENTQVRYFVNDERGIYRKTAVMKIETEIITSITACSIKKAGIYRI